MRQGRPANHLFLCPRPYGKDVPRLDYWQAYETIMKKFGGRPHWAKVTHRHGAAAMRLASTRGRPPLHY